jgi:hypothetical protein
MASGNSVGVEHSTLNSDVQGSKSGSPLRLEKNGREKKFLETFIVVNQYNKRLVDMMKSES